MSIDKNEFEVKSKNTKSDVTEEKWFVTRWRPAAAWVYLAICLFDFIIAPILHGILIMLTHGAYIAWAPLTLQGGGLIHLSFGAIIGIYTWGRTVEKKMEYDNPGEPPQQS